MKIYPLFLSLLLIVPAATQAAPVIFSDFEAPTYTSPSTFIGLDSFSSYPAFLRGL
jgi:hypothetical protein